MTITEPRSDIIVIGAGIIGCALAHKLSNIGFSITLLERDLSEPDRIVGELLQPGGVEALRQLGLYECLDGIDAIRNKGYGLFYNDKVVPLPYPVKAEGVSFHHGRFIMNLRQACQKIQRIRVIEATANSLLTKDSQVVGVLATIQGEKRQFEASLVVVADGCFSKFRQEIGHIQHDVKSHFVGAVLHDCPLPMPNNGHVILARPSPILLYQIGTHDTRVLVDVPGKLPSASTGELKNYMLDYVKPQLPLKIQESFKQAISSQRLRVMPNSFLPAVPQERNGLLIAGDALNMRHPLTGGGMTVALNDAVLLGSLLKGADLKDKQVMLDVKRQYFIHRKQHSSAINILAQALYALFSAGDDFALNILRLACFQYLGLGGIFMEHPVGLLTALIKRPMVLYLHFFSVAIYGMALMMLKPLPVLKHIVIGTDAEQLIQSCNSSLFGNLLKVVYWFDFALLIAISMPFNVVISLYVLYVAASIMLPLIWTEVR